LTPAIAAPPGRARGTGPLDSAAQEEHEREALAKFLAPVAESMRRQEAPTHPPTTARHTGSRGVYLFWFVIAFSAAAIIASFAIK
jgi:hypothetical protein